MKNRLSWLAIGVITIIAALAYLPLIHRFGYTFDDWYLMWAAKAYGVDTFHAMFSGDRPLRAYAMIPAYLLFGEHPLGYNISTFILRVAGGLAFGWLLSMLWPQARVARLFATTLFLIYPGFLSQPNAIDYQSHILALATAILSLAFTVKAFQVKSSSQKVFLIILASLFGWVYLGLMEYYIGFELIRLIIIFLLISRTVTGWASKIKNTLLAWVPYGIVPIGFVIWRVLIFEGERQATNPAAQLLRLLVSPRQTLISWATTLVNDVFDTIVFAWWVPLTQLWNGMQPDELWVGLLLGAAAALLIFFTARQYTDDNDAWKWEALWFGFLSVVAGIIPVILSNREVLFPYFSRYTLISSTGAVVFLAALVSFIPAKTWRSFVLAGLVLLAVSTHFANSVKAANESDEIRNFWWQVAWRIPMLEPASTIIAQYPTATIQEDYFIWGPANLLYYPVPGNVEYIQTTLFAALPNGETAQKVVDRLPQEYDKRREIVTYTNFGNIILFFQPTRDSCVRVVGREFSDITKHDPEIFLTMLHRSETERVLFDQPQANVPEAVFGPEPAHNWCYYYQKASLARQQYQWEDVLQLGREAQAQGFAPANPIEWIPFLQAEALLGSPQQVAEIGSTITDPLIRAHACQALLNLENLPPQSKVQVESALCNETQ